VGQQGVVAPDWSPARQPGGSPALRLAGIFIRCGPQGARGLWIAVFPAFPPALHLVQGRGSRWAILDSPLRGGRARIFFGDCRRAGRDLPSPMLFVGALSARINPWPDTKLPLKSARRGNNRRSLGYAYPIGVGPQARSARDDSAQWCRGEKPRRKKEQHGDLPMGWPLWSPTHRARSARWMGHGFIHRGSAEL